MVSMNTTTLTGFGGLLLGLALGYALATNSVAPVGHEIAQQQISSHTMTGAMDDMTMGLMGKTGDELDKAFLDEMVLHHEGAIAMAETLRAGTTRPELLKLAQDIITAQTGEIQMMKDWGKKWFSQ